MSETQFDPQEWLTTTEAAALAGCTTRNLTRAVKAGSLDAVERSRMLFFQRDDILEYIQRMKALGPAKHVPKIYQKARLD